MVSGHAGLTAARPSPASPASCVVIGNGCGRRLLLLMLRPGGHSSLLLRPRIQSQIPIRFQIRRQRQRQLQRVCSQLQTAGLGLFVARLWLRCGLSTRGSTLPRFAGLLRLAPQRRALPLYSPRLGTSIPPACSHMSLPAQSAHSLLLYRRRMAPPTCPRESPQALPVLLDISSRLILML